MKRFFRLATVLAAMALVAGACERATETKTPEEKKPGISLEIKSPSAGTTIKGNVVDLALEVGGITIVKAADDPGGATTGHFHVFIDKEPAAAGEAIPTGVAGIVHSADNPIKLTGLSIGQHKFTVVLGDKSHVRIGNVKAETTIKVDGPSVDASAPATVTAGQAVKVDILVGGVTLVKGADDKSNKDGTAGHLHLFVNKDVTAEGTPIPSGDPAIIHTASASVEIPANLLKTGENVIWVVLGYADHRPFAPPVIDKVVVTVS